MVSQSRLPWWFRVQCLLVLLTVAASLPANGAQPAPRGLADPRVAVLLERAGLAYDIDDAGDYRVVTQFDDGRSQLVFIQSETLRLSDMELREIWSIGYLADDFLPASVARDLLRENGQLKLGAWQLDRFAGRETAIFRASIPADTDRETLLLAIKVVSATADAKEQALTGRDDL